MHEVVRSKGEFRKPLQLFCTCCNWCPGLFHILCADSACVCAGRAIDALRQAQAAYIQEQAPSSIAVSFH